MSASKKSGRSTLSVRRGMSPWNASRTLTQIGLTVVACGIMLLFLMQPLGNGMVDPDGRPITRGALFLSTLIYPDSVVGTWFDGGRLPVTFLSRERVLPLAATILWIALSTLVGWPWLARRAEQDGNLLEQVSLAALLGLALLSTTTLLVGLAGGLTSPWPLGIAVAALTAASIAGIARGRRSTSVSFLESAVVRRMHVAIDGRPAAALFDRGLQWLAVGLTCAAGLAIMLGAGVPSAEFDVLEYHLQAPKEFFQTGFIGFLPHNIYANMPLAAEMHSLAMMVMMNETDGWIGGLMGKSIQAAILLLGAMLLGGFVTSYFGRWSGWTAAGLWLTSPGIAQSAMLGLIDAVLATYVLATAVAVARARAVLRDLHAGAGEDGIGEPPVRRAMMGHDWIVAAAMAGAAAAIKYPGLLFAVVPLVCAWLASVWQWRSWKQPQAYVRCDSRSALFRSIAGILLALSVTCIPWYAKNWVLAGNPVYPLASSWFGGKTLTEGKRQQWQQAHRVPWIGSDSAGSASSNSEVTNDEQGNVNRRAEQGGPSTAASTWLSSWIANARVAADDFLRLVLTSPFVQPGLVLGMMLAASVILLGRRGHVCQPWHIWLLWTLWIIGVWWFATHRIDRFWLPITGLAAGLAAMGLTIVRRKVSPWLAHAILILSLAYGIVIISSPLIADNRWFVSPTALRDDLGDGQQVPRIAREQAWVNDHLSAGSSLVMLIGEARVFEYRVPIRYSTCFDMNPAELALRGRTPSDQIAALHAEGITHIMVNWSEIERYRGPGNYGYSDWPQASTIRQWIDDGVVSQVDWGIAEDRAVLLRVHPPAK